VPNGMQLVEGRVFLAPSHANQPAVSFELEANRGKTRSQKLLGGLVPMENLLFYRKLEIQKIPTVFFTFPLGFSSWLHL